MLSYIPLSPFPLLYISLKKYFYFCFSFSVRCLVEYIKFNNLTKIVLWEKSNLKLFFGNNADLFWTKKYLILIKILSFLLWKFVNGSRYILCVLPPNKNFSCTKKNPTFQSKCKTKCVAVWNYESLSNKENHNKKVTHWERWQFVFKLPTGDGGNGFQISMGLHIIHYQKRWNVKLLLLTTTCRWIFYFRWID